MRVITLTPEALDDHAARLAAEIANCDSIRYDAVVGIYRGGSEFCNVFLKHFPARRCGARFDVALQRPSTKKKTDGVGRFLRRLPNALLNVMRVAESLVLEVYTRCSGKDKGLKVQLPSELISLLLATPAPNVLVIDDAIDSGHTMAAIIAAVKEVNPQALVRSAVVTVTTRCPKVKADFALYRNRTLVRFPWASDFKLENRE